MRLFKLQNSVYILYEFGSKRAPERKQCMYYIFLLSFIILITQ